MGRSLKFILQWELQHFLDLEHDVTSVLMFVMEFDYNGLQKHGTRRVQVVCQILATYRGLQRPLTFYKTLHYQRSFSFLMSFILIFTMMWHFSLHWVYWETYPKLALTLPKPQGQQVVERGKETRPSGVYIIAAFTQSSLFFFGLISTVCFFQSEI